MSKITRPILTKVFPRKRLFDLLDNMRKQPVIWVSGPPGCGKTTLVASYLDARSLPCLWYQIEEGDTDPATFFYYLGLAAKRVAPRKRKPLPLLTTEYPQGISNFEKKKKLYHRVQEILEDKLPVIWLIDHDTPLFIIKISIGCPCMYGEC